MSFRTRYEPPFFAVLLSPLCVVAAAPFGDSSGGWNFILAPVVAAAATWVLANRPSIGWSICAAFLTETLLLLLIAFILVVWGI
jgi:hypothetical protein